MTSNLKIAGKTLTPSDSDVASNVSLPAAVTSPASTANSYTKSYILNCPSCITREPVSDGYLYNWHAAVAYPDDTTVQATINPDSSICPKNWQLPYGHGEGKSYPYLLATIYGISNGSTGYNSGKSVSDLESTPLSFTLTGVFANGTMFRTANGHYYSRTSYNNNGAHMLMFTYENTYFIPNYTDYENHPKNQGMGVRCVAK